MLDLNYRAKIVEKRIFDKSGNEYQASFLVVFKNGRFFWKVINLVPVVASFRKEEKIFIAHSKENKEASSDIFKKVFERVSPYFQNQFFTSQMTRAPSF
jgi:bisphosphoglycerate-dependent phosphoglycerate mutase